MSWSEGLSRRKAIQLSYTHTQLNFVHWYLFLWPWPNFKVTAVTKCWNWQLCVCLWVYMFLRRSTENFEWLWQYLEKIAHMMLCIWQVFMKNMKRFQNLQQQNKLVRFLFRRSISASNCSNAITCAQICIFMPVSVTLTEYIQVHARAQMESWRLSLPGLNVVYEERKKCQVSIDCLFLCCLFALFLNPTKIPMNPCYDQCLSGC